MTEVVAADTREELRTDLHTESARPTVLSLLAAGGPGCSRTRGR
jgi:hypothetical protein